MKPENENLVRALAVREKELKECWVVGDEPVRQTLVKEFGHILRAEKPSRSDSAIYQIIGYYLKQAGVNFASRGKYTPKQLRNLVLMSAEERAAFAKATGRQLQAVNAAMQRHKKHIESQLIAGNSFDDAEAEANLNRCIDFASKKDLAWIGKTLEDVRAVRRQISGKYALSLRSPNILYHTRTKRSFHMTTEMQRALLNDPLRFLKLEAMRIKEGWVVAEEEY